MDVQIYGIDICGVLKEDIMSAQSFYLEDVLETFRGRALSEKQADKDLKRNFRKPGMQIFKPCQLQSRTLLASLRSIYNTKADKQRPLRFETERIHRLLSSSAESVAQLGQCSFDIPSATLDGLTREDKDIKPSGSTYKSFLENLRIFEIIVLS